MSTPAASSDNATRCDFARLHRSVSHSPVVDDCRKRKLEEETPQAPNTTRPATKKSRGLPVRTPATPRRQRATQTASHSSFPIHRRYPLRSQGQLQTPEPSQEHIPETEDDTDDTVVESGPTNPVRDRDQDRGDEAGGIIMVKNSIIADNESESMADNENESVVNNASHTTSIVRETPLEEQPGLEVVEHHDQYLHLDRRALDHENPVVNYDDNPFVDRPPVFTEFGNRLRSVRSEHERNHIHYTTRAEEGPQDRDYAEEARRLRMSRAGLRENLVASTTLVQTLQSTLLRRDGDEMDIRAQLTQARDDLLEAQAVEQAGHTSLVRLRSTLAMFVASVAVYAVWIWVNGPEMEYVRKRRADILLE